MFQQLIILALLAHNSLAFRLSHNKDDHHRWRRGGPSVATTKPDKADNTEPAKINASTTSKVRQHNDCSLEKGEYVPFTVYAKPGEQTVSVNFPEPKVQYCRGFLRKEVYPNRTLPANFSIGKHVMTYSFWYKIGDQPEKNIKSSVNFTVALCKCPSTTVNVTVKPGETKAAVSWEDPEPNCPSYLREINPRTSERLSVGKHVITYKYTSFRMYPHSRFDMECHVNVTVTGKFCGKTTYDPTTHVCCCDKIHEKNSGYECCGEK